MQHILVSKKNYNIRKQMTHELRGGCKEVFCDSWRISAGSVVTCRCSRSGLFCCSLYIRFATFLTSTLSTVTFVTFCSHFLINSAFLSHIFFLCLTIICSIRYNLLPVSFYMRIFCYMNPLLLRAKYLPLILIWPRRKSKCVQWKFWQTNLNKCMSENT
jgi:hypothetical protein